MAHAAQFSYVSDGKLCAALMHVQCHRVCWTPFTDPSGGTINSYSIQAFIAQLDGQSKLSATTNVSDLAFVGLATEFTLQSLRLQARHYALHALHDHSVKTCFCE